MKTRPILFNGPMVRAILDGKKTQTRRLLKPQPTSPYSQNVDRFELSGDGFWWPTTRSGKQACFEPVRYRCSYGVPGDSLYVRETWAPVDHLVWGYELDDSEWLMLRADGAVWNSSTHQYAERGDLVDPDRWRASIHMPRWASRLPLEITDVRTERVQDISDADCKAEGVFPEIVAVGALNEGIWEPSYGSPTQSSYYGPFIVLWDSIYAKRGFGWSTNPWVFAVTFKVVT